VAHDRNPSKCKAGVNQSLYRTGSSVTVTQRFYYSALHGSQFPLLDISRYWLLHNVSYTRRVDVSNERHYLHFYSNIPLPDISIITRRFSAPTVAPCG